MTFLAQLVSIFFYFWALFSKIYIFEIVTFFLAEWFSNQLNFSVAVRIYNIHVSDEAFFISSLSEYQTFQSSDTLRGALFHKYA